MQDSYPLQVLNRPVPRFFQLLTGTSYQKLVHTGCKEHFQIDKVDNFTSDFLKTNEDTATQSRGILQTFVWWGARSCL